MALTITEASAVNDVLRRLALLRHDADAPPEDGRLVDAAALLASKAHSALFAGLTADDVRTALTTDLSKD